MHEYGSRRLLMAAMFPAWVWVLIGAEILLVVCAVGALVWCQREIRKLEGKVELARAVGAVVAARESDRDWLFGDGAPETEEEREERLEAIVQRMDER